MTHEAIIQTVFFSLQFERINQRISIDKLQWFQFNVFLTLCKSGESIKFHKFCRDSERVLVPIFRNLCFPP